MYSGGDDIGALVGEIGSVTTKIGFAGEDHPVCYVPTAMGVEEGEEEEGGEFMAPSTRKDTDGRVPSSPASKAAAAAAAEEERRRRRRRYFVDSSMTRPDLPLRSAVKDGLVEDWDMVEQLWDHAAGRMRADLSEHPILLVEKSFNTADKREKYTELMFEKYKVPAVFLSKDAVLSCFALGKVTGLLLDIGGATTTTTPVYDGWVDQKGIMFSRLGSTTLQEYWMDLLKQQKVTLNPCYGIRDEQKRIYDVQRAAEYHLAKSKGKSKAGKNLSGAAAATAVTSARTAAELMKGMANPAETGIANWHPSVRNHRQRQVVREIIESLGRMGDTPFDEKAVQFAQSQSSAYELPDGTELVVHVDRFRVPELLVDVSPLTKALATGSGHPLYELATRVQDGREEKEEEGGEDAAAAAPPVAAAGFGGGPAPCLLSVQDMIWQSVLTCDRDQQSNLLNNIVVAGGGTCFEGITDRLRMEIEAIVTGSTLKAGGLAGGSAVVDGAAAAAAAAAAGVGGVAGGVGSHRVRVLASGINERAICSWLGGSILASLGTFHEMWMGKKEYDEHGAHLVNKKCP